MGIIQQWKQYIDDINYNIMIKKDNDKLQKQISINLKKKSDLEVENNRIEELKKNHIAKLINENDINKSYNIYFTGTEIKKGFFEKIKDKFSKFDGYFVYFNKANDMKLIKVKDLSFINKINNRELYNIHNKVGTYNGKPVYIIKYPYAITLDVVDDGNLYYDTQAYYNYVNMATKGNLTNFGSSFDFGNFLKQNFLIILIVIAIIILIATPQGQEFISKLIPSSKPV